VEQDEAPAGELHLLHYVRVDHRDQEALAHQGGRNGLHEEAHGQHAKEAGGGDCEAGCLHQVLRYLVIQKMCKINCFSDFLRFFCIFSYDRPVSRPLAVS
jgi:hypothetical protein